MTWRTPGLHQHQNNNLKVDLESLDPGSSSRRGRARRLPLPLHALAVRTRHAPYSSGMQVSSAPAPVPGSAVSARPAALCCSAQPVLPLLTQAQVELRVADHVEQAQRASSPRRAWCRPRFLRRARGQLPQEDVREGSGAHAARPRRRRRQLLASRVYARVRTCTQFNCFPTVSFLDTCCHQNTHVRVVALPCPPASASGSASASASASA